MDIAEPLPPALAVALGDARSRFGAHISDVRYYGAVVSTMDTGAAIARQGAAHGTVVVAGGQSSGRGRRGHRWASPAGAGLYLSIVVRPPVEPFIEGEPSVLGLITLAAGLAVAEGVGNATGLEASLKWPNDLYHGYKFAGVIAEGHDVGSPHQHVVLGVGINVHDATYLADDVPARATSIEREAGRPVDCGAVLAEVLVAWSQRYQDLVDGRFSRVVDRWRVRATGLVGRPVTWADASGEREGTTTGIDRTGALLVDGGDGVVRVTSGIVRWQ